MKSDLLESARKQRDALLKDYQATAHKAATAVRASKAKLDAAKKRVMDLEFAVITADVAMRAEQRRKPGAAG